MNVDKIVEEAILGHASTRDAIRWAMKQAYMKGVASGITAEREACAKLVESRKTGANELMDAVREIEAAVIRARGEK